MMRERWFHGRGVGSQFRCPLTKKPSTRTGNTPPTMLHSKKMPQVIRLGHLIRLELSSVVLDTSLVAATTPVEAPDQLRPDRLDSLVACQARAARRAALEDRQGVAVILGKAVFGLPEQAWQPTQIVFKAAADKPARIGVGANLC